MDSVLQVQRKLLRDLLLSFQGFTIISSLWRGSGRRSVDGMDTQMLARVVKGQSYTRRAAPRGTIALNTDGEIIRKAGPADVPH